MSVAISQDSFIACVVRVGLRPPECPFPAMLACLLLFSLLRSWLGMFETSCLQLLIFLGDKEILLHTSCSSGSLLASFFSSAMIAGAMEAPACGRACVCIYLGTHITTTKSLYVWLMSLIPALWRRRRKASLVYVVKFQDSQDRGRP